MFHRSERLARQLQEEEAREYEQSQYQQVHRTQSAPQQIPPAVSLGAGRGVSHYFLTYWHVQLYHLFVDFDSINAC